MKRNHRRRASAAVMAELREMLSGDVLREILDITDGGEVVLTQIASGTPNEKHDDGRDVWTNVTEPLEYDRPHKPRLYHPAGILFRAPKKGESAILLRPKSASGRNAPGFGLLFPDGGDGSASFLPNWWGDNDSGLFAPAGETLHVEAKDQDVKVDASAAGKKVLLQGGGKGVARMDDTVNCGWLYFTPNVPPGGAATLVYLPPDTVPVPTPLLYPTPGVLMPLRGKIDGASNKTESG